MSIDAVEKMLAEVLGTALFISIQNGKDPDEFNEAIVRALEIWQEIKVGAR